MDIRVGTNDPSSAVHLLDLIGLFQACFLDCRHPPTQSTRRSNSGFLSFRFADLCGFYQLVFSCEIRCADCNPKKIRPPPLPHPTLVQAPDPIISVTLHISPLGFLSLHAQTASGALCARKAFVSREPVPVYKPLGF